MDTNDIINVLKENGKVVAIRTDTVYGLICNANDIVAVEKIYQIKNRERKKPLALFIKNSDEIEKYVDHKCLTSELQNLLKKYWPGALTVILNKKNEKYDYLLNGQSKIGIRVPNDDILLAILDNVDFPLAETSCNISGEKEYESADVIKEKIGNKVDLIVDGGVIKENTPSTVIEIDDGIINILRVGAIKIDVKNIN